MPRKSRLVAMYNNTGAKPVDADDAGTAAAELAGRVIGSGARGSSRSAKAIKEAAARAGRRSAERSRARWDQRSSHRPAETVIDKWRTLRPSRRRAPFEDRPRWGRAKSALRRLGEWLGTVAPQVADPPPRDIPPEPPPRDRPRSFERTRPRPELRPDPGEPKMTAMPETEALRTAAPPDWAALIERVKDFQPENDVALIDWMKAEASGVIAYAEALETARENCVTVVGLDPSSVSGITTYSEHMSDASDRMSQALATFLTVYDEVLKLAAEGVVLPHNGRWMTGGTVA